MATPSASDVMNDSIDHWIKGFSWFWINLADAINAKDWSLVARLCRKETRRQDVSVIP